MFREVAEAPIGEALPKVVLKSPTLDGFISWLGQKNPNEKFSWHDCYTCAMAQWWTETQGWTWGSGGVDPYTWACRALDTRVSTVVCDSGKARWFGFGPSRYTFGDTLKALKAYRASLRA